MRLWDCFLLVVWGLFVGWLGCLVWSFVQQGPLNRPLAQVSFNELVGSSSLSFLCAILAIALWWGSLAMLWRGVRKTPKRVYPFRVHPLQVHHPRHQKRV